MALRDGGERNMQYQLRSRAEHHALQDDHLQCSYQCLGDMLGINPVVVWLRSSIEARKPGPLTHIIDEENQRMAFRGGSGGGQIMTLCKVVYLNARTLRE